MSLGVSLTDVCTVASLAWDLYKTCKESSDDFKRIATEVASLHVVLKETEEFLHDDKTLNATRRARLATLLETSNDTLKDLQKQLSSYESLGTHSQRTWDRLRWGLEDVADVRSRLISVATMLSAFNTSLANSSQARIEKKLEKFVAEIRAGYRQGSVVSSQAPGVLDRKDSWVDLQRELEDIGVSAAMVDEHQDFIKTWFKDVIVSGLLQDESGEGDNCPGGEEHQAAHLQDLSDRTQSITAGSDVPFASSRSGHSRPESTLVGSQSSDWGDELSQQSTLVRRRIAPQDFDSLLSRDEPAFPELPPPNRSDTMASHEPTNLLRKYSAPSLLLYRLFQKDTRLIKAASDGDLERVAALLSRGVNVNVRDKWGWSALSMAAYGGHESIARLLLACGAEIEITDVDGDSPLDLATNRGHTGVVIAIEEERANRVARGMPKPAVPGVKIHTGLGSGLGSKLKSKPQPPLPGPNTPAAAAAAAAAASGKGKGKAEGEGEDEDDMDSASIRTARQASASASTTSLDNNIPLRPPSRTETDISPATSLRRADTTVGSSLLAQRHDDDDIGPLKNQSTLPTDR